MSMKAWMVQVPSDSPMPFVQLMDWFDQCAKNQFLVGVNYVFYSNIPPPQMQMTKAFTIAFTTEGDLLMDTFPMDLVFHLHRLDSMTNPFWLDEDIFDKWMSKNAKGFQDPNEMIAFMKTIELSKQNTKSC